jgi:hypothetical protein
MQRWGGGGWACGCPVAEAFGRRARRAEQLLRARRRGAPRRRLRPLATTDAARVRRAGGRGRRAAVHGPRPSDRAPVGCCSPCAPLSRSPPPPPVAWRQQPRTLPAPAPPARVGRQQPPCTSQTTSEWRQTRSGAPTGRGGAPVARATAPPAEPRPARRPRPPQLRLPVQGGAHRRLRRRQVQPAEPVHAERVLPGKQVHDRRGVRHPQHTGAPMARGWRLAGAPARGAPRMRARRPRRGAPRRRAPLQRERRRRARSGRSARPALVGGGVASSRPRGSLLPARRGRSDLPDP